MKKLSISSAILFIVCFLNAETTQAQKKSAALGDARVTNALNQTKTPFTVDNDGMYQVVYELPNKRTQKIFITPGPEKFGNVELRLIFSYTFFSEKPPAAELANLLLEKNMEQISFWALQKLDDGKYTIVNIIYVPADLDGKKLDVMMTKIAFTADEMEERLTKKDEL